VVLPEVGFLVVLGFFVLVGCCRPPLSLGFVVLPDGLL